MTEQNNQSSKKVAVSLSSLNKVENMKEKHKYNLGDSVLIDYKDADIDCCNNEMERKKIIAKHPFFVIGLTRDCDGTPLYTISSIPYENETSIMDKAHEICQKIDLVNLCKDQNQMVSKYVNFLNLFSEIIHQGISENVLVPFIPQKSCFNGSFQDESKIQFPEPISHKKYERMSEEQKEKEFLKECGFDLSHGYYSDDIEYFKKRNPEIYNIIFTKK